jgi:hypothetical protein
MLFRKKRKKIFVIGRNKTGTTSLGHTLHSLGFRIGNQPKAELLIEDWAKRKFHNMVNYCKTADAFQDIPFSLDYTYQAMDYAFPGSKFILTVRNSSGKWYESLTRFHTKIVGKNRLPTADDLKQFPYRKTGWLWRTQQLVYGIDEHSLYNKEIYIKHYDSHNQTVLNYFRHRPEDLLVLNLSDSDAMQSLCEFINIKFANQTMPHLNISKDIG